MSHDRWGYWRVVRNTFAEYPSGASGVALLLLRTSLSLLLVSVLVYSSGSYALSTHIVMDCLVAAIILGVFTRTSATLCAGTSITLLLTRVDAPLLLAITHLVDAVALILLGPGAYSFDAALFGRRTIRIPR